MCSLGGHAHRARLPARPAAHAVRALAHGGLLRARAGAGPARQPQRQPPAWLARAAHRRRLQPHGAATAVAAMAIVINQLAAFCRPQDGRVCDEAVEVHQCGAADGRQAARLCRAVVLVFIQA